MRRAAIVLVVGLSCPASLWAQGPTVVPDAVSCVSCRISVRVAVILRPRGDSGEVTGRPEEVLSDAMGRFWVLDGSGPPMVYGSTGEFLASVGRRGSGPGEFGSPYDATALPGDSVMLIDRFGPRAVIVGPDLRPARTVRVPWQLGPAVAVAWPTSLMANGNVGTREGAGWPLHRVAMDGADARIVSSFGSGRGELRPDGWPELAQRLADVRDGRVWASSVSSYRLDQWTAAGELVRSLERRPEWFFAGSGPGIGTPSAPPPAAVAAIREDPSGLLWVFVMVPARSWRGAWRGVPEGAREVSARQIALEKLFATVVEVIDPATARVIARRRLDQWVIDALPEGRAAEYSVDIDGVPRIRILQLELVGR